MKKISLSLVAAASATILSGCGADVSVETKTPVTNPTSTASSGALNNSGVITQSSNAKTIIIKQEYSLPTGQKALLEGALTIDKDGIITSVEVFNQSGYIEKFAKGVSWITVGKKIAGLTIDTVSGASLTTAAFNEVLAANAN